MSERLAFIQACLDRTERIIDVCDRFGIGEKTGHKLLRRFREGGPAGLADRSHAPRRQPHARPPPPYPARLPPVLYPPASEVRLVSGNGYIKWRNQVVFLSSSLAGQYVGLTPTDGDLTTITYASLALGELDPHTNRFTPRVRWVD